MKASHLNHIVSGSLVNMIKTKQVQKAVGYDSDAILSDVNSDLLNFRK